MDLNNFQNPPKTYRPMVRWWWPGLDVEKEELLRELEDLDRSWIGGAELQPFLIGTPLDLEKRDMERAKRTHRFMQPYHYEMMSAVLDGAERLGLTIDITQNSAWPTGGTHISIEDSHKTLLFGETMVKGPGPFAGSIPPLKPLKMYFVLEKLIPLLFNGFHLLQYDPRDKQRIRVVAGRLIGPKGKFTSWKIRQSALLDLQSMVDLTSKIDASGQLEWQIPEGNWQLFSFYEGTAGAAPLMDARSQPNATARVLDHFNHNALRHHLDAFLGRGKEIFGHHFGRTFRAFFTDSFELISPMHWSDNFLQEFEKRRGYDLSPFLPAAYVPLKDVGYFTYSNELNLPNFDFSGGMGQRIRYDVQRTISDLFIDEFILTAAKWASENHLLSRVQGYGMLADPLRMLGNSHIPETEQLYGGGALHFLKLTGSAASLYSRPVATSETLVWQERQYMTTPLKWRVGLDRLFESGINQVIYHGFPYRHPDFPFPGFQPFASPHTATGVVFSSDMSRDNPLLFESAPHLNAYASRAQYLLQRSRTQASIGIFYQLFDYPNGTYIQEELVRGVLDEQDTQMPKPNPIVQKILPQEGEVSGDRLWIKQSAELGSQLVANGYYYQFFNEECLLKARVENRRVLMGEATFEALVLFKESALPAAVAQKLSEIALTGVPVLLVGSAPDHDPGYFEHEKRDEIVREAAKASGAPVLENATQVMDALHKAQVQPQVGYLQPHPSIGFIHKVDRGNKNEYFFLRNRLRSEQSVEFTLASGTRVPIEFNLWKGTAARLPFNGDRPGTCRLNLYFSGYTSRMIALVEEQDAAALPEAEPEIDESKLVTIQELHNFNFTAKKRLPSGKYLDVSLNALNPGDWRAIPEIASLSSQGEYQIAIQLDQTDPGQRYFICFDRVCDRADIRLNGHDLPTLLVMPWRIEVTGMLRSGPNELIIKVTPTLRNTLVGYGNSGERQYQKYRGLTTMSAGLIGSVRLCRMPA
jgi:hypothetical protein